MNGEVFVDTNIWLYAVLDSPQERKKHKKARDFLRTLYVTGFKIVVSAQVINELYVNLLKNGIPEAKVRDVCKEVMKNRFVNIEKITIEKAWNFREKYNFSYWDSLIVAAAWLANCETLFSEDMQDGLIVDGQVKILNPLR